MRFLALVLITACLAGGTGAARAATQDRVYDLLGKWSCRTTDDATATQLYVRAPDEITFVDNVTPRRLPAYSVQGRMQTDAVTGGWSVTMPVNAVFGFHGTAPPWNATSWAADGYALPPAQPVALRERYELLDANAYRRVFERTTATGTSVVAGEVCRRGDAPPPADTCIVPDLPGATLRAASPKITPEMQRAHVNGTVYVAVSLDASSAVTATRISSSPSTLLDRAALDAAQASVFRTAVRDCKPVAQEFLFGVTFAD